ncbi:MAG: hypothetical protein M3Y58_14645 [Chloroflexota bacterium]|nr:hypothetical protein [Chloroflexota bacterium]
MKITDVKVFHLEGGMREGLAVYETAWGGSRPGQSTPHRWTFTEIHTDEGLTGLAFGGDRSVKEAGQLLIGEDPIRVEYLWEKLYAVGEYRQRIPTIAVLDLALWDLIGKSKGEPVYRLLGGPTRERVRAYAAMLGFSTDPDAAARRSVEMVEAGFQAVKWYLPYGQATGREGMRKNVALIKAVRDAVGDEIDIMVDCIMTRTSQNSVLFGIDLARRLEEYRPFWLEEPLNYDDRDAHATLARATRIPLAFAEHFYTRWQIRDILESRAATVVQPDPVWAGGVTEMRKIIALASTYGVAVVPHGNESCRNALHILFAQPERVCPLAEWGVRINHDVQYFFTDFYAPKNGYFEPPTGPGFGYVIDAEKVVRRVDL